MVETKKYRGRCGIIQRYHEPVFDNECVIQVQWTPKLCFMETRKNINKLTSKNLGNLNKCITFDGPLHLSSMKNIGVIVKRDVRNASNEVADHIAEVCYENRKVKNMQLYWKVTKGNVLYFLYCSYMKMEIYGKRNQKEVELRNNFNLRNDIDFIYDTSKRKSTLKFKNLICLNCENVTIAEKFIKIKNDWIFKFYEKRVEVPKIDHDASVHPELEETSLKVYVKNDEKLVLDHWTDDMKLPLYFRKKYKIDRYNKKDEILFFTDTKFKKYKESLICIDCYLEIVNFLQKNKTHSTNIYDSEKKDDVFFPYKFV